MPARVSHHISRKGGATLLHSARAAAAIGKPLNVAVCIHTWSLGISAEDVATVFGRMRRQRFGRWSSYKPRRTGTPRNGTPSDTSVIEAPKGRHHVHWMLHIAPENRAEFERKLVRWVKAMARLKPRDNLPAGALHVQDATNPEGKKLYMAKGIDPLYGKLWGIRPVNCGLVHGRRVLTARALGPATWKPLKAAYQSSRRAR